ncbi:beta-ketoacyl synthase N-terminal-like domain-containing protein [Sphingobacterium oryzagri]|uniref:Beta-ketoacyl synthase N-terminal-like domain-containing protein n=1 Tax=Sphingobacterium oryzagri TaxID=3025669 RepID=A0ABY7WG41_9SPHI|nr:beta-ketoacyl synthase N-terminal-like domain-containing protein [Sphingobacterium sp. KACC 22765]WDF68492.1 beta-ketoacyl synthase N-terminal-like domain-containing protein [Sphingobacterium sp. KACC 22765]
MTLKPVYIHDFNCVTPLGADLDRNWESLLAGQIGLTSQKIGFLPEVFASKIEASALANYAWPSGTRLEKMMYEAVAPIRARHQPTTRTAFIVATTKGNISDLRNAATDQALLTQLADRLAKAMDISTTPIIVSHACVSGVLAVAVAKRLIQMGSYDDAIVLAGDEVGEFVVSGFQAFQAMSPFPCKPFDKNRAGVSLGEATACVYISATAGSFEIVGESSINDANHISGPSRTGEGLYQSVRGALLEAGLTAADIDYISAHGTATAYNDEMEAIAFNRLALSNVPVNSLKGVYGHTLGASGLLETVIGLKCMIEGLLIPTAGFEEMGVSQPLHLLKQLQQKNISYFLKTASGFGGSNAALIIKKV